MRTREQFVEAHINELFGMVADAAVNHRREGELSIALRQALKKIHARLGAMYEELRTAEKPPENGKQPAGSVPAQPARKS